MPICTSDRLGIAWMHTARSNTAWSPPQAPEVAKVIRPSRVLLAEFASVLRIVRLVASAPGVTTSTCKAYRAMHAPASSGATP